jgi:hypothetical protein
MAVGIREEPHRLGKTYFEPDGVAYHILRWLSNHLTDGNIIFYRSYRDSYPKVFTSTFIPPCPIVITPAEAGVLKDG